MQKTRRPQLPQLEYRPAEHGNHNRPQRKTRRRSVISSITHTPPPPETYPNELFVGFLLFCYPSSLTAFEVRRYEIFPEIPGIEPKTGYRSIGALAITYVHVKQDFPSSSCHTHTHTHTLLRSIPIWAIHLSSLALVWCLSHLFFSLSPPDSVPRPSISFTSHLSHTQCYSRNLKPKENLPATRHVH